MAISDETQALAEVIAAQSSLSLIGVRNTVAALVSSGAILPRQGRSILLNIGENAGGPQMLAVMRRDAARFMTQRPINRPRRA
jgi:hypothetical protein